VHRLEASGVRPASRPWHVGESVTGPGKDKLNGGPGNDTITSKDGIAESVNCGSGRDKVKADKKDKLKGCESRAR
jgi:hypothetical protein